jgi:hypothetical protein
MFSPLLRWPVRPTRLPPTTLSHFAFSMLCATYLGPRGNLGDGCESAPKVELLCEGCHRWLPGGFLKQSTMYVKRGKGFLDGSFRGSETEATIFAKSGT